MITFTVRTYDDIVRAEDYDALLRQHKTMLAYFAAMHAIGASDVQAMLREKDRRGGMRLWGRARRVAAPLRKLAEACKDGTAFLSMAKSRFIAEYGDEMTSRTRRKVDGRRTMEF